MTKSITSRPPRLHSDIRLLFERRCDRCLTTVSNTEWYRVLASLAPMPALARQYAEFDTCLCWQCHCQGLYRLHAAIVGTANTQEEVTP